MSFRQLLTNQHRACDAEFILIEQAAARGDWTTVAQAVQQFIDSTEAHFRLEEEILFPHLEQATPMAQGPTAVMRNEHAQMRELFADLLDAVRNTDQELLGDCSDTLLMLMQQHNAKEENVLYPIADRVLDTALLAQLTVDGKRV